MIQAAQILGALLLLAGFLAAQAGAVTDSSAGYLAVNTAGAGLLATVAAAGADWGFLLLEGVWAAVAAGRLPSAAHLGAVSRRQARRRAQLLPAGREVVLAGDELSSHARLARLFRDSYLGAQGRQWLQPLILWWELLVLRDNGIQVNWAVLGEPATAESIAGMGLPAGHVTVRPEGQAAKNFRLWWALLARLIRLAYRRRAWSGGGRPLPAIGQVRVLAEAFGLRPWMSSATREETAGIGDALTQISEHRRLGADEFMVRVLLPGLLLVELHWAHIDGGRPSRNPIDLVLERRHAAAARKAAEGRYLTPLEHMYVRAGDVLAHLQSLPPRSLDPVLRRVVDLARELHAAHERATSEQAHPPATGHTDDDRRNDASVSTPGSHEATRA